MAFLIDCPGCGNSIVNNGQDCPFCGYSVKTGKTREEMEQELLAAEEALRAEEEAKAAEEAKRLEEERRIEEEKRAAEEAKRLEEERLAEQARLAAEEAKRQAQQNSFFGRLQQRKTNAVQQTDISEKVNNDIENLPEIPTGDSGVLPPMQLEREVSVNEIMNAPTVNLTPLPKEKEQTILPPMQLERKVSMDEIMNTPAVPLSSIQKEVVENALPDINSPDAGLPKRPQTDITVEMPSQKAPSVRKPEIDIQVSVPNQPAKPSVVLQKKEEPVTPQPIQQPVQPQQRPQRQWSSNPNEFNGNQPMQQPVQPQIQQPQMQQPVQPQQRPQRQWSSNPNEFNGNQPMQQPVQPQMQQPQIQQPVQPQQPRPQRQLQQQRQWSSNPNEFNNGNQPMQQPVQPQMQQQPMQQPAQPQPRPQRQQRQWSSNPNEFNGNQPMQQPVQPQMQQQPMQSQQPRPQRQPQQPRQQRQWSNNPNEFSGNVPLQPIQQERSEMTSTGERLSDLPPQQVPSDPSFDQTSYVKNLKKQMYAGKMSGGDSGMNEDIFTNNSNVVAQPMKHDENAKVVGVNVNRVTAPKSQNKIVAPIIIILILVIALGVVAYITLFQNPLGGDENESSSTTSSQSSETSSASSKTESKSSSTSAGTVKFKKPDNWESTVYAYVYVDEGSDRTENAKWPGEEMTDNSDGTYSYDVAKEFESGMIIFNDNTTGRKANKYPQSGANSIDFGIIYEV